MSDPFAPAVSFTPDPRSPDAQQPRVTPERPIDAEGEHPTVVLGEGLGAWIAGKLAAQPWYVEPQPSISQLVEHARHGEWTCSDRARRGRLTWLHGPARLVRAAPWALVRFSRLGDAPGFGAGPPSVREVVEQIRDRGRIARYLLGGGYLLASICSRIADYATRTGVVMLWLWLIANWANNVPVLRAVTPDVVTAAYWWRVSTDAVTGGADAATSWASRAAPFLGNAAGTAVLIALGLLVLRSWWRGRNREDSS